MMNGVHKTSKHPEEYREFVVKTHHVWLLAVVLIALCAFFFWMGRWYERKVSQYYPGARMEPGMADSLREQDSTKIPEDMEQRINFFDRLESEARETGAPQPSDQDSSVASPEGQKETSMESVPSREEPKGSFYTIQVLAGYSQNKAKRDSDALEKMGFSSYIEEERQSQGTLYKVRVGKYGSEQEARREEARLKKKGYQTWLLKVD